jgi:hypothetical protein
MHSSAGIFQQELETRQHVDSFDTLSPPRPPIPRVGGNVDYEPTIINTNLPRPSKLRRRPLFAVINLLIVFVLLTVAGLFFFFLESPSTNSVNPSPAISIVNLFHQVEMPFLVILSSILIIWPIIKLMPSRMLCKEEGGKLGETSTSFEVKPGKSASTLQPHLLKTSGGHQRGKAQRPSAFPRQIGVWQPCAPDD